MEGDLEIFGDWLKKFRLRMGLSQQEFADVLGLSTYVTVGNIERGKNEMSEIPRDALMQVAGVESESELEELWRSGKIPDVPATWSRTEGIQRAVAERVPLVTMIAWTKALVERSDLPQILYDLPADQLTKLIDTIQTMLVIEPATGKRAKMAAKPVRRR